MASSWTRSPAGRPASRGPGHRDPNVIAAATITPIEDATVRGHGEEQRMARMSPIPAEQCTDPDLSAAFDHLTHTLGFVPNSVLTMQRVPAIAKAVIQLNRAV